MRLSVLAVIAICVGACALQNAVSTDTMARLKGRHLTPMVRYAAPFSLVVPNQYTAANFLAPSLGLVGAMGTAAARSDAGQRFVRENAIEDPAFKIARDLGDSLRRGYGFRPSAPVLALIDDDPTKLSQANPAADLVLDVWTESWSAEPLSSESASYTVKYTVNIRLIDAKSRRAIDGKSGVVVAEGSCESASEDAPLAPTLEGLVADHARRLKGELDKSVQFCVNDFRTRILLVPPEL